MVSKAAQAAAEKRAAATITTKQAWENAAGALEKIAIIATKKIDHMEANSQVFTKDQLDVIPKFSMEELSLGRILGKGGFGTVTEIRTIQCTDNCVRSGPAASSHDGHDVKDQELQDKKFIADHCIRDGGDSRYCIKALSPDVIADKILFVQGVTDMATETMFLSAISHPHIVTMRAFGANGMLKPNYFIVLDRLYDTLEARIPKWRVQSKRAKSVVNKMRRKSIGKLDELMETKLRYAYDLTGAFEYLHKKGLVYRDLKPENVGFNIRDDIVLFDFGLAREIQDGDKVTDNTWKLTGETGSLRYMAPEVASNKPYGHSADVYSFSIMLWEMLKMERPFSGFSKKMHSDLIIQKGMRPKIENSWAPSLKGFLKSCWHQDLTKRPSAARASIILKREAAKAGGGSDLELNNFRRKSTFVNRNSLRERRQ